VKGRLCAKMSSVQGRGRGRKKPLGGRGLPHPVGILVSVPLGDLLLPKEGTKGVKTKEGAVYD